MYFVYVLNKKGKPLMPTTRYAHVRRLLKNGKAVVVNNNPFTIRLKYETPDIIQSLTLGIDTGRENIGLAVSNENGKCLYLAEIATNNKFITKVITERREYRNSRRLNKRRKKQRKALQNNSMIRNGKDDFFRHKKKCKSVEMKFPGMNKSSIYKVIRGKEAKFNNRKRKDGWITPSAQNLLQIHISSVKLVQKILPISEIIIERVNFDFNSLDNQDIKNWDCSKGTLYGFKNYKEYINDKQISKCLLCEINNIEEYHHIVYRSQYGSNAVGNIAGLCKDCHQLVHNSEYYENKLLDKKSGFRKKYNISLLNSCMHLIIDELNKLLPITVIRGYDTSKYRKLYALEKSHCMDAFLISISNKNNVNLSLPTIYNIRHFKKKSNNMIKFLGIRKYYYNDKLVAINRHKAYNQKEDSLEEYMNNYSLTHTEKECKRHFHELKVFPAVRIYTYHRDGLVSKFKCGDKVLYKKINKKTGKINSKVFIIESVKVKDEIVRYGKTKCCNFKYCNILESKSLQYI